MTDDIQN